MRKYIVTALVLTVTFINTQACEICGCGNNNFQIGILPTFTKGFMGVRYSVSQFNSVIKTDVSEFSSDNYKTMEVWGGYNFDKFQVMAFMPYVISRKESDDGVTTSQGTGDLLLLLNYKLMSNASLSKNESVTVLHELYAGGGIKLPTGINQVDIQDPEFNIGDFNSQAGTGSIDYLLNVTHNVMWNKSGIVTNIAYRINGTNQQDYRFGNRAYLNAAYYYTFTAGKTKLKPSAGFNYQTNAINTFADADVEDSNGYNLNATLGLNVLHDKIGLNAMGFLPVVQDMYAGQTTLQSRLLLGMTYSF